MMKNKLKSMGITVPGKITTNDFLINCDSIFYEENKKLQGLINKSLSQWLREKNNEIDSMFARFVVEKKFNPSDCVIIERDLGGGLREISIKHKNTSLKNHLKSINK